MGLGLGLEGVLTRECDFTDAESGGANMSDGA